MLFSYFFHIQLPLFKIVFTYEMLIFILFYEFLKIKPNFAP